MPRAIKSDTMWQEEDDAQTLARAESIKMDKKRMVGATRGAKRLETEITQRAKNIAKEAISIKKIAKKTIKVTKKTTSRKK